MPVTSGSAEFTNLFHHERVHGLAVSSDLDAGGLQGISVCVVWAYEVAASNDLFAFKN